MQLLVTRRMILLASAGVGLASFSPIASATEDAMAEAIRDLIGEAPLAPGKVKLELPSIVENGNTVPLTVSVESPMTEADHVESIHIFNQKNPQPYVAAFHLGPRAGKAPSRPASGLPTRNGSSRSRGSPTAASGRTAPMSS